MSEIAIKMTLQQAEVVSKLLQVVEAETKVDAGLGKVVATSRKAEAELKRFAEQATRIHTKPIDEYHKSIEMLKRSLEKKLITPEVYEAGRAAAQEKYRQHDPLHQAAEKTKAAERQRQLEAEAAALKAKAAAEEEAARKQARVAQIVDRNLEPLDRYKRKLQELRTLQESGLGSREYAREVARLKEEFHAATGRVSKHAQALQAEAEAARKAAEAEKEANAVRARIAQVVERNLTPLEKYQRQLRELRALQSQGLGADVAAREASRLKRELDAAGSQGNASFGSGALSQLKGYAAGLVGVGAVVTQISKAFQLVRDEQTKAIESLDKTSPQNKNLAQVAGGEYSLGRLKNEADAAAAMYGVDRNVAREVRFDARSGGFDNQYQAIMRMGSLLGDPRVFSQAAGKVPQIFGGKVNPLEAINMTKEAADAAFPNIQELLNAVPQAGERALAAGSRPEEVIASLGVLSGNFKDANVAASRLNAFQNKLALSEDPRLQGKGLIAGVESLRAMSEEDRKAFLKGDTETLSAFDALSMNLPTIKNRTSEVARAGQSAGTAASPVERSIREALSDPETRAVFEKNRAATAEEIEREKRFALDEAKRARVKSEVRTQLNQEKTGIVGRFGAETAIGIDELFGSDAETMRGRALYARDQAPATAEIGIHAVNPMIAPIVGIFRAFQLAADHQAKEAQKHTKTLESIDRTLKQPKNEPPPLQLNPLPRRK